MARAPHWRRAPEWTKGLALVAALAALSCLQTVRFGFVCDDTHYILANPYLRDVGNWGTFFASEYWESLNPVEQAAHRPLLALSLSLDGTVYGRRPAGYHVTNGILHTVASLLVVWAVRAVARRWQAALLAGALFAVSPAHVEAVAWVKNRGEMLAASSALTALALYAGPWPRAAVARGAAALIAYLGTILCKLVAAGWPLLLVPYERYVRGRRKLSVPAALALLALALGGYCALATGARGPETVRATASDSGGPSLIARAVMVGKSIATYVRLAFFGARSGLYPDASPPPLRRSLLLLATAVFLVWAVGRKARGRSSAVFWTCLFVVALLPVMNLKLLRSRPIALQRVYLASVGVAAIVACAVSRSRVRAGLCVALLAVSSSLTVARSFAYASNERLYDWTILTAPNHFRPYLLRATQYLRINRPRSAIRMLNRADTLNAACPWVDYSLASAHLGLGDVGEALTAAGRAQVKGCGPRAQLVQGNCLEHIGRLDLAAKCYEGVLKQAGATPSARKDLAFAANNLGNVRAKQQRFDQAMSMYRRAMDVRPAFVQPHVSLGALMVTRGRYEEAARVLFKAVELSRAHPASIKAKACFHFARALEGLGEAESAAGMYQRALDLGGFVEAQIGLARLMVEQKRFREGARLLLKTARSPRRHPLGIRRELYSLLVTALEGLGEKEAADAWQKQLEREVQAGVPH